MPLTQLTHCSQVRYRNARAASLLDAAAYEVSWLLPELHVCLLKLQKQTCYLTMAGIITAVDLCTLAMKLVTGKNPT